MALAVTGMVHVMIVGIVLLERREPVPFVREDEPIIVTILPAQDKPAHHPVRGVPSEPSESKPLLHASKRPIEPVVLVTPTIDVPPSVMLTTAAVSGGKDEAMLEAAQAYRRVIRQRLLVERRYPAGSLLNGYEGSGVVVFRIDRTGRLIDAFVETSTGHAGLDRAALDTVRRAAPFPVIPEDLPDELEIGFPIAFLIDESGAAPVVR